MSARSRRSPEERDREATRAALRDAVIALERAQRFAGCWADEVRQRVEQRLGVPFVSCDPRVLNDAEYGAALDRCGPIDRAVTAACEALRLWDSGDGGTS